MSRCRHLIFFRCHSMTDKTTELFLLDRSVSMTVLDEDDDEDDGEYSSQTNQNIHYYLTSL